MSYSIRFQIAGLPKNANARLHWAVRAKENAKWKAAVGWSVKGRLPKYPLPRAKVTCIRRSSSPTDADNIVAGFKPILDGLVTAGVLADDKWANIGMPEYRWELAPAKKGHIEVTVEEIES